MDEISLMLHPLPVARLLFVSIIPVWLWYLSLVEHPHTDRTLGSWLQRCRDLVDVSEHVYRIADPCLALWLRTRSDEQPYLSTLLLGNEAEKTVARRMAAAGFELIFQSRASRGAFDLLAILGRAEVGVQVKKTTLPFYLSKDELQRMQYWAGRMGWIPLLALVDEGVRFDESTPAVDNLLGLASR